MLKPVNFVNNTSKFARQNLSSLCFSSNFDFHSLHEWTVINRAPWCFPCFQPGQVCWELTIGSAFLTFLPPHIYTHHCSPLWFRCSANHECISRFEDQTWCNFSERLAPSGNLYLLYNAVTSTLLLGEQFALKNKSHWSFKLKQLPTGHRFKLSLTGNWIFIRFGCY